MGETSEAIVQRNRGISMMEGCFYAVMVALGESLLIPFGLLLGFKASQIAIVATLPIALGGLAQFLTPRLEQLVGNRKFFVIFLLGLQATGLALMGALHNPSFYQVLWASVLYWIGGAGVQPVWIAWMIPANPSKNISNYHARRNALVTFVTFGCFIAAGLFLEKSLAIETFRFCFLAAALARTLCAVLMVFHFDQKPNTSIDSGPTLQQEIQTVVDHAVGKPREHYLAYLIGILVLFRAGAGLSAPHFSQYMLHDLHLNYAVFTLLVASAFLGRTLLLQSWIHTSHEFGSKNTLLVSSLVIALVPLFWTVSSNLVWLFGIELLSGGAWAGFELLTLMILSGMGLKDWARAVGILGSLGTVSALLTGWLGGKYLESGGSFITVCIASGVVRLFATGLLIQVFRRHAMKEFSPGKMIPIFFNSLSLRPSFSNINWVFWRRRPH